MDAEARGRVGRIARLNGGSIAVVAGAGALFSLAGGDLVPAAFGAAVLAAGLAEHRAGRRLASLEHDPDALRPTLVRAELAVLAAILGYAAWRLATASVAAELAQLPEEERAMVEALAGGDRALLEQLFESALRITYGAVVAVALVYQGGMAWWYTTRVRSTA